MQSWWSPSGSITTSPSGHELRPVGPATEVGEVLGHAGFQPTGHVGGRQDERAPPGRYIGSVVVAGTWHTQTSNVSVALGCGPAINSSRLPLDEALGVRTCATAGGQRRGCRHRGEPDEAATGGRRRPHGVRASARRARYSERGCRSHRGCGGAASSTARRTRCSCVRAGCRPGRRARPSTRIGGAVEYALAGEQPADAHRRTRRRRAARRGTPRRCGPAQRVEVAVGAHELAVDPTVRAAGIAARDHHLGERRVRPDVEPTVNCGAACG